MITLPISWFSEYNSLVLTGILVTNILIVARWLYLDWKDRQQRKKPPHASS
jgi:hypothetical protein